MSIQSLQTQIDINNPEDIFTQPETTYENILEYFDNYIKSFYAYKDEPTYKAVISFFIKYYIDLIYNIQKLNISKNNKTRKIFPGSL